MAEEWDVFSLAPGGDYAQAEYLATLYNASQKSIRVEENDTGSGSFAINRTSPECTETILARGNLVKVRIPEIDTGYLFAFFLESGDFTLISSDEAGGEMLTFGGRGILSYLEYARAWNESYVDGGQDPIAGIWRAYLAGTGDAPGQVLRRLIEEFQDSDRPQSPLSQLTVDFDYDNDSNGDPWIGSTATTEFSYAVGDDGLTILDRLLDTDVIHVEMGPDFDFHAYNEIGRDLTGDAFGAGVVRFERGVNIATELRRAMIEDRVATHVLVQGEGDAYGTARLSDHADRVTKEAYLATFGTEVSLPSQGRVDLRTRLDERETIAFQIANRRTEVDLADPVTVGSVLATPGVAAAGYYLPGPEGTNGDFWLGDIVRLHTGSGQFDYTEVDARVKAITITRDDDNHELIVTPELQTFPPSLPVYGVLYKVDTNSNVTAERVLNWGPAGDTPPSGYLLAPTIGLIEPLLDPSPYDAGYPNIGWTILGTGTVNVYAKMTASGVLGGTKANPGTCVCTFRLRLNTVEIASTSQSFTGFLKGYGVFMDLSISDVDVVPGDVIDATFAVIGTGIAMGGAKVARGTGAHGERLEITGGSLA